MKAEDQVEVGIYPSSSSSSLSLTKWWSKETVAIVTGANKGIGFAVVKRLAELGLTVILTARDVERGEKAVDLLRRQGLLHVSFCQLDVSDSSSIRTFVLWFKNKFGVLDILVNNAAVSFNDIGENSVEYAEIVMKTNFYGAKLLTESLLPFFRLSPSKARILNISSRLGSLSNGTWESQGWPELWTDYAVSKLALNAYSRVLAKRYEKKGISVNYYCPGFTQTSMTRGQGTHSADDAAEVVARLVLLLPEELSTAKFYIGFNPFVKSKL
ncbi:hypothetical protein Pint_26169 [Pistacia integerrima]|uniref:Uncharacterized protein n=1 Tax=Pistacia integerrima TaxID=434235 RepID=A0ACC0YEZ1_9ROSI|nr:hypothetical protein Pint_26169 [Pistacia integerrima]